MVVIKNSEKITIDSSQDDLNIILEEILTNGRPSRKSLDQLEYDLEVLNEQLDQTKDDTYAHNIAQLIELIERVLKEYLQTTGPIRVNRFDRDRLNAIGPTQPKALSKVLDFWDEHH